MGSIWEKAFGKKNAKSNAIRELAEEIIDYKNDYGYQNIAEVVIQVGSSHNFTKEMDCVAPIHKSWTAAEELDVLDDAIMKAIAEQGKKNNGDSDNGGMLGHKLARVCKQKVDFRGEIV